jgi:hypothetical protein
VTAYSIQHTAYSIHHTTYNIQHTTYNMLREILIPNNNIFVLCVCVCQAPDDHRDVSWCVPPRELGLSEFGSPLNILKRLGPELEKVNLKLS